MTTTATATKEHPGRRRAETRWAQHAKKPLLESDGTTSIPAYYGGDIGEDYDKHQTLFARCPFCNHLNDDDHIRIGSRYTEKTTPKGACKHFVKLQGGCGAYDFVFRQPK